MGYFLSLMQEYWVKRVIGYAGHVSVFLQKVIEWMRIFLNINATILVILLVILYVIFEIFQKV